MLEVHAQFGASPSWSKKKKAAAYGTERPFNLHTMKPDLDNIAKAVCDGCNGVLYLDDCQIVHLHASKIYDPTPRTLVIVKELL